MEQTNSMDIQNTYSIEIVQPEDLENFASNDNIIELTDVGIINLDSLCRICANRSDHLLPIFEGEGIKHQLEMKINRYFPFNVEKNDILPVHCCYQCASTILTWHELVEASIEADRRLRALQFHTVVQLNQKLEDSEEIINHTAGQNETGEILDTELIETCDQKLVRSRTMPSVDLLSFRQAQNNFSVDYLNQTYHNDTTNKDTTYYTQNKDKVDSKLIEQIYIKNEVTENIESETNFDSDNQQSLVIKKQVKSSTVKTNCKKRKLLNNRNKKSRKIKTEKSYCSKSQIENLNVKRDCMSQTVYANHDNLTEDFKNVYNTEDLNKKTTNVCIYCGENFGVKSSLIEHKLVVHKHKFLRQKLNKQDIENARVVIDKRVYYQCNDCQKKLHTPYTYMWHRRIHTGERPYVCDLCGKQFRVSQGLVRHLRDTHAGIKNFSCDLCGRQFATRRNVEEHRRIHTNERPYICDLCGKSFKQKASLFVHSRSHTDSFPHKCSYCGKGFRSKAPLLIHVTRHTGEKPYPCDICGRRFRIKYELKRHKLVHSDEKPFSCEDCGISFRQKRYLRNHNKINHGEIITS